MIQRLVVLTLLSALLAAPAYADARGDARKQVEFGIAVAQRGLWREAVYRWQRATEIDPTYAHAFNNLGIAYEQQGDLAKAREAYERAMQLEPNNALIKQNYDLFKEINDRTGRANGR
jgi:Flp pilus assembly protein TadD